MRPQPFRQRLLLAQWLWLSKTEFLAKKVETLGAVVETGVCLFRGVFPYSKSTEIRWIAGRPHFREVIRQDRSRNRVRRGRLWPRRSGPSRFGGLLRARFRH